MAEHQRPAPGELEEWSATLSAALGLPESFSVDVALILDLARDAAHGVARPAAPLTTFLVGYAAGLSGGGGPQIEQSAEIAARLATGRGPVEPHETPS